MNFISLTVLSLNGEKPEFDDTETLVNLDNVFTMKPVSFGDLHVTCINFGHGAEYLYVKESSDEIFGE